MSKLGRNASLECSTCQPHHSWNGNHVYSNWALFHLQRHSDHHAHPTRRYQSLRHFENLPQLPDRYFGMFGMFVVVYVPRLWFGLMDSRVVAWAQGDASRIHVQPGKKTVLMRRYGKRHAGAVEAA